MGNEIVAVTWEKQVALANAFAASKMFGVTTPEQALSLMALCEAEGIHPAKAVQDYNIIQGRPSLKADAMLTRFQRAGGKVHWKDYTDTKVTGVFEHPQGGSIEVAWDMERAKQAGLGTKDMWKKYPRQMLRSRVISEAIRAIYPGVTQGLYSPEEVSDFEIVDVTPKNRSGLSKTDRTKFVSEMTFKYQSATTLDELNNIWDEAEEVMKTLRNGSGADSSAASTIEVEYMTAERRIKEAIKMQQDGEIAAELNRKADNGDFDF